MSKDLLQRLQNLATLKQIPLAEFKWLIKHGELHIYPAGLVHPKGYRIDKLWILLEGHISVRIDRGAGPKVVNTELNRGSVTGKLPYSRMSELPGDTYADKDTEVLTISEKLYTEMINKCPEFTAHTVHSLIDRTRIHTTSAMQDEKMIAMGRLAAGLAHELNNPASVAIRDAKLLREIQGMANIALRQLSRAGIDDQHFEQIEILLAKCSTGSGKVALSSIEKADLQDNISDWLEQHKMESALAAALTDLAVTTNDLETFLTFLPHNVLQAALQWIISRCQLDKIAAEIEQSTNQICTLVDAVKKFTHMDNLAEKELVDVKAGICDALKLLEAKSKEKRADIKLQITEDLPRVYANGAQLNQVWFSLLDNALDAIFDSGKIDISAGLETDMVAVRICDNGPGIPADKIERVFDPFYTTKPPGQGTGLGLDLSRRFIRSYNGDISVRSQPGKTEFCINLNKPEG